MKLQEPAPAGSLILLGMVTYVKDQKPAHAMLNKKVQVRKQRFEHLGCDFQTLRFSPFVNSAKLQVLNIYRN